MSLILSACELSSKQFLGLALLVCIACICFVRMPFCSHKKQRSQSGDLLYCMLRADHISNTKISVMFSFYHGRKAIVLKAQNQMLEAHKLLQKLLIHCQEIKNAEIMIR